MIKFYTTNWKDCGPGNTWAREVLKLRPLWSEVPVDQLRRWMYSVVSYSAVSTQQVCAEMGQDVKWYSPTHKEAHDVRH
jgi:hypothetical protein